MDTQGRELLSMLHHCPGMTRPLEEHLDFVRMKIASAAIDPEDYQARSAAAKLKLIEKKADKMAHDSNKAQLEVAKLRGEMAPVADIRAEGDAIGAMLSAELNGFGAEAAIECADKSVAELEAWFPVRISELLQKVRTMLDEVGKSAAAKLAVKAKEERLT